MTDRKYAGEMLLVAAGIVLLLSLPIIVLTGSFFMWVIAKAFYAVGVALFVFNK